MYLSGEGMIQMKVSILSFSLALFEVVLRAEKSVRRGAKWLLRN